ncbi:MAG: RNA methyltransferase, partial [Acidobacteriaceae bacterium]|nr:RNA methyltransferase [Acidobacteriaceae bacterium]
TGVVNGLVGESCVIRITDEAVWLSPHHEQTAPEPWLDLILAVPRPKVMRRLWAQLAAMGVGRILLTNAARVERNYFDTHILTPEVFRPLLLEGLQQAKDTRLPSVTVHRQLKVLVEDDLDRLCPDEVRLMADPPAQDRPADVLRRCRAARVLLAIGPEGGWTEYERTLLGAHGFRPIGVGPRTLRTDTACVALLAVVHDALRELT